MIYATPKTFTNHPTRSTSESTADFVRRTWASANGDQQNESAKRWRVALKAFRAVGSRNGKTQEIANAIYEADNKVIPIRNDKPAAPVDVVERLARAYRLFYQLCEVDCQRARKLRRVYGYSKWAVVWDLKFIYEFPLDKAWDYLEYEGGAEAVSRHAENVETDTPEWERRAASLYKDVSKLRTDFGVPQKLVEAANAYVKAYDEVFPRKVKK